MAPRTPPSSTSAAINAARIRAGQQNMGYGDQAMRRASSAISGAVGRPATQTEASQYIAGTVAAMSRPANSGRAPVQSPIRSGGSSSSSRGRGGGGGGGGGVGGINQARMDQLSALLRNARPGQATASTIDLPDYQAPQRAAFNGSMYDNLNRDWEAAYQQDAGTQAKAGQDLLAFLAANQTNPYTNGNNTYAQAGQAPGQSIAQLQQLAQSQGVDPSILAAEFGQRAAADQAFGNMWRSNAAATDTQNQGNVARANTDIANWAQGLNAQRRAGGAQIGLARGQAQNRYDEQSYDYAREDAQIANQIAMQEAMANWERANQVGDTNLTNSNSYRNAVLEALLGMVPSLPSGTALPDISKWGL